MQVVRVNKVKCGLRELLFGTSRNALEDIEQSVRDGKRGPYVIAPPLKHWAGGVLYTLNIHDTELLHRYFRMNLRSRKALVHALCATMHKHEVCEIEVELPWGTSVKRVLNAYMRDAPEGHTGDVLWLSIASVK